MTTIEMRQIVIVKRTTGAVLAWCTECLKNVELVPPDQAAHLAAVSLRDLCRQVDANEIHIVDTANGGLICLDSLLKKKPENFKESS